MMTRFAVYYAPRPGAFADRAAHWLGWDAASSRQVPQPDLPGLPLPPASLTADPRRYGFHGTLRAPFRLAEGVGLPDVETRLNQLAQRLAPVICTGLALENLDGFLALTPQGDDAALMTLAARVVEETNDLRAALTPAEVARRRPDRLTQPQRRLLDLWGYPFVMEAFRFHLTLTDRLAAEQAPTVAAVLEAHFAEVLPRPFAIEDLCLFAEDQSGQFHLLHRFALTG